MWLSPPSNEFKSVWEALVRDIQISISEMDIATYPSTKHHHKTDDISLGKVLSLSISPAKPA